MKSFNEVYRNSKMEVLAEKAALIESQRVKVIKAIKEMYLISGNMSELPKETQQEMKKRVLEYWTPKEGLTKAGIRLLNEKVVTLNTRSCKADLQLYIESQVKEHHAVIIEAYRTANVEAVVEAFKEDVYMKTGKRLTESFIKNTVWNVISNKFKNGDLFI